MHQMQAMRPHLGFAVTQASDYPNGPVDVKEAIGYSQYWGGNTTRIKIYSAIYISKLISILQPSWCILIAHLPGRLLYKMV